jgi:hypothetical protein
MVTIPRKPALPPARRVAFSIHRCALAPVGERRVENGVPVQTFKAYMLRTGRFEHPVDGWEWDVDSATLVRLKDSTARMMIAGNPVEVTVDHGQSARDTMGYARDLSIEGGTLPDGTPVEWLVGLHDIRGEENIRVAEANRFVSIETDRFTDSAGQDYGEVIVASSIVRKPVVTHQPGFIRVAASHGGRRPAAAVPLAMLMPRKPRTFEEQVGDAMAAMEAARKHAGLGN